MGHEGWGAILKIEHDRLKRALKNQLILRGNRDFESRKAYARFLEKLFAQLNAHT